MGVLVTRHVAVAPPAVTDQLAPAMPTGASGTNGTGSVTFSCNPTADMHDGVTAASGVSSYTWNIGGVDQTPIAAPSANVSALPTLYQVGSFSPVPTSSQNGRAFTASSAGIGFDGTTDQLALLGWEVTGDFDLEVNLDSFTGSGYAFAPAGLMWREATAATVASTPTAKYGSIYTWLAAATQGFEVKHRTSIGGTPVAPVLYDVGNGLGRWYRISRRTNTISYSYSALGSGFTEKYSTTYTGLSSTLVIGGFTCDLQASPQVVTARFTDLHYTAGAQASITTPAYSTSTTVSAYVKATDANGYVSAVSPTVTASGASSFTQKFNPGIFLVPDNASFGLDATRMSALQTFITSISNRADIVGIMVKIRWAELEGATQGDCAAGFAAIDQIIAWLNASNTPKKLWINVQIQTFGAGSAESFPQLWYPQYAINAGCIQTDPGQYPNTVVKVWTATAVDILTTFAAQYGNRYDNNSTFAGWTFEGETAISTMNASQAANLHTQTKRRMTGERVAFPRSELRVYINFYYAADTPDLFAHARITRHGMAGPDPELPINADGTLNTAAGNYRPIDGAQVFRGNINLGNFHDYPPGGIDQRGFLPSMFELEGLGIGSIDGYNESMDDIFAYAKNTLQATHMFISTWDDPDVLAPNQRYSTYTLPLIAATNGAVGSTTRPSLYI